MPYKPPRAIEKNRFSITMVLIFSIIWLVALIASDKRFHDIELNKLVTQSTQRLAVYQNSLQSSISKFEYLPGVLSTDPRISEALLNDSDAAALSPLLRDLSTRTGAEQIYVMTTNGDTIASSNYWDDTSFVGQNYSFRPYFKSAINAEKGFYFAVGATSGLAGLFFAEAIYHNGAIIGVVVVKITLENLADIWSYSGDKVWITDSFGVVFLSYDPQWLYRATRPLSDESRDLLARTKQYGENDIPLIPVDNSTGDYASVDLADLGSHILFQQKMHLLDWKVNWLYSCEDMTRAINQKKLYITTIYVLLVMALLWLRERYRGRRSEQRVSQLSLQNEARQRALIDSTDAGLIIMDNAGNITFINAQARLMFRLRDDELPDIRSLISPWQGIQARVHALDATGTRVDGTHFPMQVSTNAIGFSNSEEYLVTVHDVSELKQAQLDLMHTHDKMEQRISIHNRP